MSQVQEFQLILHDIHAAGMLLSESFQVAIIIEKLPPSWKDFKNYVKHKHKKIRIEDIIPRLRIKKDNKLFEKRANSFPLVLISGKTSYFWISENSKKKIGIFVDLFIGPLHFCFVLFCFDSFYGIFNLWTFTVKCESAIFFFLKKG